MADLVRAYVEDLVERMTGADKAVPDQDGDYPLMYRGARYYVRVVGEAHPVVQVFATAVRDVEATPELLASLNAINTDVRFVRLFHVQGQVLVETDLVGSSLDPVSFDNACQGVATVTLRVADDLVRRHGGTTGFQTRDAQADDPGAGADAPVGLYM